MMMAAVVVAALIFPGFRFSVICCVVKIYCNKEKWEEEWRGPDLGVLSRINFEQFWGSGSSRVHDCCLCSWDFVLDQKKLV